MTEPIAPGQKPNREDNRRKEQHRQLHDALKETNEGLIDFEYKWGTALLVLGGWILTAKGIHEKLAAWRPTIWILVATLVLMTLSHAAWVRGWYRRSRAIHERLCGVGYMRRELFDHHRITKKFAWGFVVFNLTISILIAGAALVVAYRVPLPPE